MQIATELPAAIPPRCNVCGPPLRVQLLTQAHSSRCETCGLPRWLGTPPADVTVCTFGAKDFQDTGGLRGIRDQLDCLLAEGRRNLLLDFAEISHLSNHIVAMILMLNKKVQAASGWLGLCNLRPEMAEVFWIVAPRDKPSKQEGDQGEPGITSSS